MNVSFLFLPQTWPRGRKCAHWLHSCVQDAGITLSPHTQPWHSGWFTGVLLMRKPGLSRKLYMNKPCSSKAAEPSFMWRAIWPWGSQQPGCRGSTAQFQELAMQLFTWHHPFHQQGQSLWPRSLLSKLSRWMSRGFHVAWVKPAAHSWASSQGLAPECLLSD